MLTCYDALTAEIFDRAGIDMLLVGDSRRMWCSDESTLTITLDEMIPLVAAVSRGAPAPWWLLICRLVLMSSLRSRRWRALFA